MAVAGEPSAREGYLYKLGAANPTWKKRYFKLDGSTCRYTKKHTSSKVRAEFELVKARGVREKEDCWDKVAWPRKVSDGQCFGLSTEDRTYYFYAESEEEARNWKTALDKAIAENSTSATSNWRDDPKGRPDSKGVKVAKGATKIGAKFTKVLAKSGVVPGPAADVLEGAAEFAENQASMDGDATLGDRLRVGAGDVIGTVGSAVDNDIAKATTGMVKDQLQADKDASATDRALTAAKGGAKLAKAGLGGKANLGGKMKFKK